MLVRLYCITVPCYVALDDAADEPVEAVACLLPLVVFFGIAWRFLPPQRHPSRAQSNVLLAAFLLSSAAFLASFWQMSTTLFSLGYERARDTTKFPSAACQAIGVTRLDHVPPLESNVTRRHGEEMWRAVGSHETTWRRGHYPYKKCPAEGRRLAHAAHSQLARQLQPSSQRQQQQSRPLWILLPASVQYVDVIGPWAKTVHAAGNMECVVGRLDRSIRLCDEAKLHGCRCVQSAITLPAPRHYTSRSTLDFKRNSARATAVRARFGVAAALLRDPLQPNVLMHDADAAVIAARRGSNPREPSAHAALVCFSYMHASLG